MRLLAIVALAASPAIHRVEAASPVGTWVSVAAPTPAPSGDHTATLLSDGRVLVVGGSICGLDCGFHDAPVSSAQLFDPTTRRWTATGSTSVPREYHTATLLPDGRVLVAGGYLPGGYTPGSAPEQLTGSAEVYSPRTGRWTPVASMHTGRIGHTATLLRTGKVLVAGGFTTGARWISSAELFDPATAAWTNAGSMNDERADHTATLLPDGNVLVTGGRNTFGGGGRFVPALRTAELYDAGTGAWRLVPHLLISARENHSATLLRDGNVLIAGGATGHAHGGTSEPTASAELYHPAARTFTGLPPMPERVLAQTATLLPDGRVLIAGGIRERDNVRPGLVFHRVASPEIFDPTARTWTPAAPLLADPTPHGPRRMIEARLAGNHTATLVANSEVLVLGGDAGPRSAQIFSLTTPASGGSSGSSAGAWALRGAAIGVAAIAIVAIGAWLRRRRSRAW